MPHRPKILTLFVRRSIMVGWFVVFFVVSPTILLYAAGYRYDFTTHTLKQTGVVEIDVGPEDADVQIFFNDIAVDDTRLTNRAPGQYRIRFTAPGYKPWQKNITVGSNETTYLKNITLFKEALPIIAVDNTPANILSMHPSATGEYIYFLEAQDTVYLVHELDTNTDTFSLVWRGVSNTLPKISWSPYGNIASIETVEDTQSVLALLNPNTNEQEIYTFDTNSAMVQWKPLDAETIFIEDAGNIYSFSFHRTRELFPTPTSTLVYVDHQNVLWFLDQSGASLRSSKGDVLLLMDIPQTITHIRHINGDRAIFDTTEGIVVASREKDKLTSPKQLGTSVARYNVWTEEWTTWSENEIWNIRDEGDVFLLDRTGNNISFVKPLDEFGILLVVKDGKLIGFNPGYYVSHELFAPDTIEHVIANTAKRKIYFLGSVANKREVYSLAY